MSSTTPYTLDAPVVRCPLPIADAERIGDLMPSWPQDVRDDVALQLWLLALMLGERKRTPMTERPWFDERCSLILEMLDPEPEPAS